MKQLNLFFIFAFILVGTLSFTSAVPPFQTIGSTGMVEYLIEYPKIEYVVAGENFTFHSHVYFSNGTHILNVDNTSLGCYLDGYSSMGDEIFSEKLDYDGKEWKVFVPGEVLPSVGSGYYLLYCDDTSGVIGAISNPFEIVNYIETDVPSESISIIYSSLLFILLIVLLFLAFIIFKTENFGIKMGLTSFAYIIVNVFLLVCWKISEIFLSVIPFLEVAFRVLYIISNVGYLPAFIGVFVASLIHMTNEKNINTLMDRGYSEDRAISMTKRK